jgi:hypothetical protein
MKTLLLSVVLTFTSIVSFGQTIIDWTPGYILKLSDFQSPISEINNELNTYSIQSAATMDFAFHMSSAQFMFTKNFNAKVRTIFNKSAASISAPDSVYAEQLVRFGRYNFDLTELYSRKFRKELYEQKGAFSNASFFRPIYDKLQIEMNNTNARVLKESELGKNKELLDNEHKLILVEIETLSGFCKECKPPKKKKGK